MRETTLAFGADQGLVGTLTLPAAPAPHGMILFNAGVVPRIGPHRINVKIARELGGRGIPAIRFDLHGMGDSLGADGRLGYRQQAVADIRAAMDALQRDANVERFTLLGFCSGALPSYWTAQADERVRHIILYDAFNLQTPRSRLRFLALRLRRHGLAPRAIALYLRRSAEALLALKRRRRARAAAEPGEQDGDKPSLSELARGFAELASKGVRVSVLHSGADFSNVNHPGQIAEALGFPRATAAEPRTGFLAQIDHIMTSVNAQNAFVDWICADVLGEHCAAALRPPAASRPLTTAASASAD